MILYLASEFRHQIWRMKAEDKGPCATNIRLCVTNVKSLLSNDDDDDVSYMILQVFGELLLLPAYLDGFLISLLHISVGSSFTILMPIFSCVS